MNVLLTFQTINTSPRQTFFNPLKWMETDAKLSLCKCKHFQKERSCSVLYFTQLNNEPSWHRSPGKYITSLRDSFLRSLSTPATQHLPFSPIKRVQGPLHNAELSHRTASYLTTYSGLICMPAKVGFCPSESWWATRGLILLILEHQTLCCHGKATRDVS